MQLYNAHILHLNIRRSELQVLQGEGHFFAVTCAIRTAELIRGFLSLEHGDEGISPMMANGTTSRKLHAVMESGRRRLIPR